MNNRAVSFLINGSLMSFIRSHRRLVSIIIGSGVLCAGTLAFAAISSGAFTTKSSVQVTTTTLTLDKPSTATSDVMLATIAIHGGSSANISTVPTGWTLIARTDNDAALSVVTYWKKDSGSEPSSYEWIVDGQTTAEGGITAYSGVSGTVPVDASAGNTGLGLTATTSAITTTAANDEVVAVYAVDEGKTTTAGSYFSTSTGMTQMFDVSNTPFGPSLSVQEATQATAGTVASKSSSIGGNNKAKNWATQVIALRPPSGNTQSIALANASQQFLSISNASTTGLGITGNISIEAWVKLDSEPATGSGPNSKSLYVIAGKDGDGAGPHPDESQRGYDLQYRDVSGVKKLTFEVSADGNVDQFDSYNVNETLNTGTWYHVAVVWTAASHSATFYVNGSAIGTDSSGTFTSIFNNTAPFMIGSRLADPVQTYFDGKVDEVRVWSVARTSPQIANNMSTELTGSESGLVGYWQFEGSLNDGTADGNTLTNNGGATFSNDVGF